MATIGFLVPTLPLRCRGRTSGWILVALRVLRDLVSAEKWNADITIQSLVRTDFVITCQVGCMVNIVLIGYCLCKGSTSS